MAMAYFLVIEDIQIANLDLKRGYIHEVESEALLFVFETAQFLFTEVSLRPDDDNIEQELFALSLEKGMTCRFGCALRDGW